MSPTNSTTETLRLKTEKQNRMFRITWNNTAAEHILALKTPEEIRLQSMKSGFSREMCCLDDSINN